MDHKIHLNKLQDKLKEVIKKGYGKTIELKYNGILIPNYNLLRFSIPTTDNLKNLNCALIELKINGEFYEVLKNE